MIYVSRETNYWDFVSTPRLLAARILFGFKCFPLHPISLISPLKALCVVVVAWDSHLSHKERCDCMKVGTRR